MSDPNKRHYRKWYAKEFERAHDFLIPRFGGYMVWVEHDYQAFQYRIKDDVTLVFYPHKTSAMNHHIRVREQGSKDKARANAIMAVMAIDLANDCTFHQKGQWPQHWFKPHEQDKLRKAAMESKP